MFRRLFTAPTIPSPALRDELQSLCHSQQFETLALSRHVQRDIGIDCGCDTPTPTPQRLLPLPF